MQAIVNLALTTFIVDSAFLSINLRSIQFAVVVSNQEYMPIRIGIKSTQIYGNRLMKSRKK